MSKLKNTEQSTDETSKRVMHDQTNIEPIIQPIFQPIVQPIVQPSKESNKSNDDQSWRKFALAAAGNRANHLQTTAQEFASSPFIHCQSFQHQSEYEQYAALTLTSCYQNDMIEITRDSNSSGLERVLTDADFHLIVTYLAQPARLPSAVLRKFLTKCRLLLIRDDQTHVRLFALPVPYHQSKAKAAEIDLSKCRRILPLSEMGVALSRVHELCNHVETGITHYIRDHYKCMPIKLFHYYHHNICFTCKCARADCDNVIVLQSYNKDFLPRLFQPHRYQSSGSTNPSRGSEDVQPSSQSNNQLISTAEDSTNVRNQAVDTFDLSLQPVDDDEDELARRLLLEVESIKTELEISRMAHQLAMNELASVRSQLAQTQADNQSLTLELQTVNQQLSSNHDVHESSINAADILVNLMSDQVP